MTDIAGSGGSGGAAGDCPNRGNFFVGCSFEARYDTAAADGEAVIGVIRATSESNEIDAAFEALRPRAYVRDICTRCGKTVERKP